MSGFSVLYDNKVLDAMFKNKPITPTPDMHWALFRSEAGLTANDPAQWEEVNEGGYERVPMAPDSFTDPVNSMIENIHFIEFPIATADWGTVTHVALMDGPNVGADNVMFWGLIRDPLTLVPRPRTIVTSDQYIMRPGTAVVRIIDSTMV